VKGKKQKPQSLFDSLSQFKTGEVYQVFTKDQSGNFQSLSHENQVPFADRVADQLKDERDEKDDKDKKIELNNNLI